MTKSELLKWLDGKRDDALCKVKEQEQAANAALLQQKIEQSKFDDFAAYVLPRTKPGQIIFGIGCGLLTCFIRRFGSYPEGVCYSILIMNCTTWLLDKYIRPTIYGAPKKEKKEAAAK